MNWVGDLIQEYIDEDDTVLDLGCGIMQPLLDVVPSYPKTRLKCKRLFGVDIHQPYLDFLNDLGIETLNWDLRKVPIPFQDKSFDIVLLTDILEHLEHWEYVNRLIRDSIRIARKKVIVLTPNKFVDNVKAIYNPYPYEKFIEDNEFQRHHLFINKRYLEENGFKVMKKKRHYFAVRKLVNKILHVWDCAGVAGCLSKYQKILGYDSCVFIGNKKDIYGFDEYYDEKTIEVKSHKIFKIFKPISNSIMSKIYRNLRYYKILNEYIVEYDPDIIHFHGLAFIALLFPFRKKIFEFHGTSVRKKYGDGSINKSMKTPVWLFHLYKLLGLKCLYSTPDLKEDIPEWINAGYLNNPVDVEHFRRIEVKNKGYALYSINHYEDANKRLNELKDKYEFSFIEMLDRAKGEFIKYEDMPNILKNFEFYIDRNKIQSLSKTALECLAMGLKVIDWKNDIIEGLPHEHNPFNVARKTLEIYDKIMVGQL